jgi:hypothetical protein
LVWPQNQGRWFVSGFASKPLGWVSCFGLKTKIDGLSMVWPQNHWNGFSGLSLRTGSYGWVIWASKSPRRFLGSGLKTMWDTVCWLRHKTGGRDLAAYFMWKQVGLGFSSLALRLVEARHRWCMWHHHEGCIESKLKIDGSMRWATSDPSTPTLAFSMYYTLGAF